jgi:hypothetical protein
MKHTKDKYKRHYQKKYGLKKFSFKNFFISKKLLLLHIFHLNKIPFILPAGPLPNPRSWQPGRWQISSWLHLRMGCP